MRVKGGVSYGRKKDHDDGAECDFVLCFCTVIGKVSSGTEFVKQSKEGPGRNNNLF